MSFDVGPCPDCGTPGGHGDLLHHVRENAQNRNRELIKAAVDGASFRLAGNRRMSVVIGNRTVDYRPGDMLPADAVIELARLQVGSSHQIEILESGAS